MKKNLLFIGLSSIATCAIAAGTFAALSQNGKFLTRATDDEDWVHYARREATPSELGIREYWIQCGGSGYQFTAPAGQTPRDADHYDTSEFETDPLDERYFPYMMDEDHCDFTISNYGASMYCTNVSDYKNWRATYTEDEIHFNLYSEGGKYLWRIDLPRIDFTKYPTVTIDVAAPNWYENNMMGPEADQLTYHTVYGGNKNKGKINLALTHSGVHMDFVDMEYGNDVAFSNTFTDSDILHGLKSAYFYTEDLYDRYLNLSNIVLSTTSSKTAVMHYAQDTTKVSLENATATKAGATDYSIIGNGYATADSGLELTGNANPGAMVATLPAVNLDSYLAAGVVTTTFGVKNNGEHMYWGSGASKIDLGTNSATSQSENNSGYVNWQLTIMDGVAYVHNVKEDKNYIVELTPAMRNGTAGIVISGGDASVYRVYLVTDFYWQLTPDYPLVAPASPMDIYSYAQDKTKLSVENGTVSLIGSTDYSIINNSYATNDTGLCVNGNANPGATVITLPVVNLKPFAAVGKVTTTFGVKNNGEHMYWGSGEGRVDLGTNSPSSESNNNNGYVNWELVVTAEGAYVHNVYADQNINVTLTAGMRNGTESIVISGGNTSVYRVYLVTDFYWSAL